MADFSVVIRDDFPIFEMAGQPMTFDKTAKGRLRFRLHYRLMDVCVTAKVLTEEVADV